jgi:hypothetical protein
MLKYNPELTLRDARERYFALNNFPGGGYEDRWVKVRVGAFPLWFPNVPSRKRAVRYHDLHHILTEYETTWRGEAEIGAWEVATGGAGAAVGWLLDLLAFAVGLVINPRGVYRAFVRGRHSANLFRAEFDDALLAREVGATRSELRLNDNVRASASDRAAFVAWSLASVVVYLASVAALLAPLVVASWLLLRLVGGLSGGLSGPHILTGGGG